MRSTLAALAVLLIAGPAGAAFPDRPVTLLASGVIGGSDDTAARLLAPYLQKHLAIAVPVNVRSAPEGAAQALAVARADGHTLGLLTLPETATNDPVPAMTPIGGIGNVAAAFITVPSGPQLDGANLRVGVGRPNGGASRAARDRFGNSGAALFVYGDENRLRGALAAGFIDVAVLGKPTALRLGQSVRIAAETSGAIRLFVAAPKGLSDTVLERLQGAIRRVATDRAFQRAAAARGLQAQWLDVQGVEVEVRAAQARWRAAPWTPTGVAER